jgi:hypothetical protein
MYVTNILTLGIENDTFIQLMVYFVSGKVWRMLPEPVVFFVMRGYTPTQDLAIYFRLEVVDSNPKQQDNSLVRHQGVHLGL